MTETTTDTQEIVDRYTRTLSEKETVEIERLLQKLVREKFEYEEAKFLIERYEFTGTDHNDAMITACEKILKTRSNDTKTRRS